MRCTTVQRRMSRYLDGTVGASRRAKMARHLEGCAQCAGHLAAQQTLRELLGRLEPISAPDVMETVEMRCRRDHGREAGGRRTAVRMVGALAAAALLMLSVAAGMWAAQPGDASNCPSNAEETLLVMLLSDVLQGHEMESCLETYGRGLHAP